MVKADDVDDFDFELPDEPATQSLSKGNTSSKMASGPSQEDLKTWITLYPIYIDAKRSKAAGHRRIGKAAAVEWPLARNMAIAANQCGFPVHVEAGKTHPADWQNPGRIRLRLTDISGRPYNPKITNKAALLKLIAARHDRVDANAPIYDQLPPNSPYLAHGILQHAIENPKSMMPPGMEGLMGGPDPAAPSIEQAPTATQQSNAAGGKSKGKKKVVVVRR